VNLIQWIKSLRFNQNIKRLKRGGIVNKDSIYTPGFHITSDRLDPKQISIGINGVFSCQLIFERNGHGKIVIGDRCHLGGNTKLISIDGITIGNDVTIAWDCTLYDHNSHPLAWEDRKNDTLQEILDLRLHGNPIARKDWSRVKSAPITIEDKVWLGFGVTVLKGVRIGEGAVVGAMSVVTKDVPPYAIVAGNPAQVVRTMAPPEGR